jgi:hypothetical protein
MRELKSTHSLPRIRVRPAIARRGTTMLLKTLRYHQVEGWLDPLPMSLNGPDTLVLAFGASEFADNPGPFAELAQALPDAVLLGCSTSGEIAGSQVHDASISVAVARFEHTALRRAATEVRDAQDSWAAGARLAQQLCMPGLRAVFVLSDGLHVNGTPLVAGLTQNLPQGVAISGGLAGDGSRFNRTWVLDGAVPAQQRICAVGFYGERLRVGHGHDGGWSDFGPERRITRSEGNVLYELDGKPALDLYKAYLGDRAAGLPGTALLFPLSLRREGGNGEPLVRTILGIDEERRSLTFAGDMPQGGIARLMRTHNDHLIDSAGRAVARATQGLGTQDTPLVVSVSCVGRRLVLGERTDEEVETVLEGAPCLAGHVGFYSYGEIAPALRGGASDLHNQTMTVTVFSEAADASAGG